MDMKLRATYLDFWVIVVVGDLGIGVVLVDAHVHLGHADFLSGKESSDCCLTPLVNMLSFLLLDDLPLVIYFFMGHFLTS